MSPDVHYPKDFFYLLPYVRTWCPERNTDRHSQEPSPLQRILSQSLVAGPDGAPAVPASAAGGGAAIVSLYAWNCVDSGG